MGDPTPPSAPRRPPWEDAPAPAPPSLPLPPWDEAAAAAELAVSRPLPGEDAQAPELPDAAADGGPRLDPGEILARLVAESRAKTKPTRTRNTVIVLAAVFVALVLGLILGIVYLEHQVANLTASGGTSSAQSSLNAVLVAANRYSSSHGVLATTSDPQAISTDVVGSTAVTGISITGGDVAVNAPTPTSLLLTSLQGNPEVCFGILIVFSSQQGPIFAGYPQTAATGTYYFEGPATTANTCDPTHVTPPAGGSYVSSDSFPRAALPAR